MCECAYVRILESQSFLLNLRQCKIRRPHSQIRTSAHSHISAANIHSHHKYFHKQLFALPICPILQALTALKQIASILLLGLLFFNWYGYRIVSDYLQQKADTKLEAIQAAEKLGYRVTDVVVLVDREQGGVEQLTEAGYKLRAAFKLSQLMAYYRRTERISQERYDEVMTYLAAAKRK